MKKKYFISLLLLTFFILAILFFFNFHAIKVDRKIKKETIKELKGKIYVPFFTDEKKQVTTGFSWKEIKNDSVYWQCDISESERLKFIQFIDIHTGNGFGGIKISVVKIADRFNISLENNTDNLSQVQENQKEISIENQNLILDKKIYKKGDSIFGKIDLVIKEEKNNKINISKANGYFKGKID